MAIFTPGNGGVRIVGNLNHISDLDIGPAGVRPNFNSSTIEGMLVIKGKGYLCEQVHVECSSGVKAVKIGGSGPVYAGYETTNVKFYNTWIENEPDPSGITWHLDTVNRFSAIDTYYVSTGKLYIKNCYDVYADFATTSNVEYDSADTTSYVKGGGNPKYFGYIGKGETRTIIEREANHNNQFIDYKPMTRFGNMIDRKYLLDGRGSNVTWSFENVNNIGPTWKAQWTTQPSGFFSVWLYGLNPANVTDVNNDAWFSAYLDWDVWDSVNGTIIGFYGFGSSHGSHSIRWKNKGPVLTKLPDCASLTGGFLLYIYGNSGTIYLKDPSVVIGKEFVPPPPPQKYFYSSDGPIWGFGTEAPTTGYWPRGSRIFNSAPSGGGIPGWVCVASGVPGIWKNEAGLPV